MREKGGKELSVGEVAMQFSQTGSMTSELRMYERIERRKKKSQIKCILEYSRMEMEFEVEIK